MQNGGAALDKRVAETYKHWTEKHIPNDGYWGHWPMSYDEMPVNDEFVSTSAKENDIAVVVIGRSAGEDRENKIEKGSWYLTSEEEKLLGLTRKYFKQVCVIINSGSIMDVSGIEKYKPDALMFVWQGGQETGNGIADVLLGKVSPSGKLTDTLAKIATEKAGIIKNNIPVIIGEAVDETRPVFLEKAAENGSEIIFAEDNNEILSAELRPQGGIAYEAKDYGKIIGELGGLYQAKNASTILCALKKLSEIGLRIDNEAITAGFANVCETTGLLGRWQKIKETPTVICDTGHNVGGWKYISRQLSMQKCEQMRIVFGMVDDKDVSTVMSLLPKNAIYYFTKPDNKRALDVNTIMEIGKKYGLTAKCFPDVKCAYQQALSESSPADFIFVGGSSYIVADFLSCCV